MKTASRHAKPSSVIFDVIYGFIPITSWEEKIIDSPFFQRLRWIKQLGFANYVFPGAEHTRFAHAIGVMHSMHQMVRALDIAVPDSELFDSKSRSEAAMLHKSLRVSALLHDIGTFPFSHAIEHAYIRHGNDSRRPHEHQKELPNSHEHLGSFIIKNTRFDGGLTRILEDAGLDVQLISKIIKGDSKYHIANQLMHSDLDADRMDYLIRDSYFTGIKYGQFDRDYILANLTTFEAGRTDGGKKQLAFGVRENASHAVEDFLIARFSWYSQVIKDEGCAKFDIMSSYIAEAFLEADLIHQFHDLLSMVEKKGERFFWFHDHYFLGRCQEVRYSKLIQSPMVNEMIEMLLYRRAPKTLELPLFEHRILKSTADGAERTQLMKQIKEKVADIQNIIKRHGTGKEWVLADLPERDVVFTMNLDRIKKKRKNPASLYMERDPVMIVSKSGQPMLLVERENSLMKHLSGFLNIVPCVYGNEEAFALLRQKKIGI